MLRFSCTNLKCLTADMAIEDTSSAVTKSRRAGWSVVLQIPRFVRSRPLKHSQAATICQRQSVNLSQLLPCESTAYTACQGHIHFQFSRFKQRPEISAAHNSFDQPTDLDNLVLRWTWWTEDIEGPKFFSQHDTWCYCVYISIICIYFMYACIWHILKETGRCSSIRQACRRLLRTWTMIWTKRICGMAPGWEQVCRLHRTGPCVGHMRMEHA